MPTYEYVCTSCGNEFEMVQRITEPPRQRCPKCRCKVTRRPGRGAGILFKGSGFYATDYRSSEYKAKAKAESGKAESGKAESGKAETGNTAGKSSSGTGSSGDSGGGSAKPETRPSSSGGDANKSGKST